MIYYRTVSGEILSTDAYENIDLNNENVSNNIVHLLEVGDLVKIEFCPVFGINRIIRLFRVDSIMYDGALINLEDTSMSLQILDGEFTCKKGLYENVKPVILSVITHEMLQKIEFKIENELEKGISRQRHISHSNLNV